MKLLKQHILNGGMVVKSATGTTSIKYFLILIRLNLQMMQLYNRYHKQRSLLTWVSLGQMKYSNYQ